MTDLGVVVLSCDKYRDLWPPYFESFFRAWPDCPFKIHLAANSRSFAHSAVVTLQSGADTDWSSSVRRSIEQVEQDFVLLFYDDAFLTRPVPTRRVFDHFEWLVSHRANYLRMRPLPRPDLRVDDEVGLIQPGSPYRTSLFASIWRKQVLVDLLKDGETAWDFELQGLVRADSYDGFYSTYTHVFSYLHGVEKGQWLPWTVRYLRKQGIAADTRARSVMSLAEATRYVSRLPAGYALRLVPTAMWPKVFRLKRSVVTALKHRHFFGRDRT
jgi:hypothetical protein